MDIDACMEELGDFPDYSNMFICKNCMYYMNYLFNN